MPKMKDINTLLQELKEVDKFITKEQVTNGGCFSCMSFASLMTDPDGKPFNIEEEADNRRFSVTCSRLKRRGFLTYKDKSEGGLGWEVAPPYRATAEEGGVKVVRPAAVDTVAALKSKLPKAENCYTGLHFLELVAKAAPSTSVSALLEAMDESHADLLDHKAVAPDTKALDLQKEMEQYEVAFAGLASAEGKNHQLCGVNLWQLYRIAQALGAVSKPASTPDEPKVYEATEWGADDASAPF